MSKQEQLEALYEGLKVRLKVIEAFAGETSEVSNQAFQEYVEICGEIRNLAYEE